MFARSYFHPGMSGDQQKLPHPLLPPHPPQQNRRRIIHRQLSFPKPPHPLLPPHKPPLLPPQQHNNRMIQRIELQPPSLQLHPPQFVAAKSLIFVPPNFSYTVSYDREKKVLRNFQKELFRGDSFAMIRKGQRNETKGWRKRMSFVLIVESDEVNAARIRTILESVEVNFEYELHTSAEEAIASVEYRKPDVMVADIHIPMVSGTELFSMIQMMSPETICIALADGGKERELITFLNTCRIFKIILKPCRLAEDLLTPVYAAFAHQKELARQALLTQKEDEEWRRVYELHQETSGLLQAEQEEKRQLLAIIAILNAASIDARRDLNIDAKERIKRWYQWMLEEYVGIYLGGTGTYEQVLRSQLAFCHSPESGCTFQMQKHTTEDIEPEAMNEIAYILRLITGVCRDLQKSYQIQVLIEQAQRAYILRVRYGISKDALGNETSEEWRVKNPVLRRELVRATRLAIEALGGKSALYRKEHEDIVNIAVLRK